MVKKVQTVIPEVVVVPETPKPNPDLELFGKLRNEIIAGKENFTQQLKQIREAITTRTKEIETLRVTELKLQGAIEASEIYLKSVLPSNNTK